MFFYCFIRTRLLNHGYNPGPILAAKSIYIKKLALIERGLSGKNSDNCKCIFKLLVKKYEYFFFKQLVNIIMK